MSEDVCPAAAKSDERSSNDGHESRLDESPKSLPDLLIELVREMRQQNELLVSLVGQNAVLINQNVELIAQLIDSPDIDEEPTTDMSGQPIRTR